MPYEMPTTLIFFVILHHNCRIVTNGAVKLNNLQFYIRPMAVGLREGQHLCDSACIAGEWDFAISFTTCKITINKEI